MREVGDFILCVDSLLGDWAIYEIVGETEDYKTVLVEAKHLSRVGVFFTDDYHTDWDDQFAAPAKSIYLTSPNVLAIYGSETKAIGAADVLETGRAKLAQTLKTSSEAFKIAKARHENAVRNAREEFAVLTALVKP